MKLPCSATALLYGLHEANTTSTDSTQPIMVEGPLDVLALTARARVTGDRDLMPFATCGIAVAPTQAQLIADLAQRCNSPVVVAMDGDTAGRDASLNAGGLLRRAGCDVRIATLPNGTDPADCLANPGSSLDTFRASHALPLLTVQVQRCIAEQGDHMQWVEGRVNAARNIARILTDYPPEHTIAEAGWISDVLDLAPATFTGILADAYRDTARLPSSRGRVARRQSAARSDRTAVHRCGIPQPVSPSVSLTTCERFQ